MSPAGHPMWITQRSFQACKQRVQTTFMAILFIMLSQALSSTRSFQDNDPPHPQPCRHFTQELSLSLSSTNVGSFMSFDCWWVVSRIVAQVYFNGIPTSFKLFGDSWQFSTSPSCRFCRTFGGTFSTPSVLSITIKIFHRLPLIGKFKIIA